jgi:hypothetical protein
MDEHNLLRDFKGTDAANKALTDGRILWTEDLSVDIIDLACKAATTATENGDDVLVLCATNADAIEISRKLVQPSVNAKEISCRGKADTIIFEGDLVRTRQNNYVAQVFNGQRWTVVSETTRGVVLRDRSGFETIVSHDYFHEFVELAGASTIDSAQGLTVDQAIVVAVGIGATGAYSAATRGKKPPIWITPDRSEEGAVATVELAISRWDVPLTVVEELSVAITTQEADELREGLIKEYNAILQFHKNNPTIASKTLRGFMSEISTAINLISTRDSWDRPSISDGDLETLWEKLYVRRTIFAQIIKQHQNSMTKELGDYVIQSNTELKFRTNLEIDDVGGLGI